jgi:hypothetical protein
VGHVVFTLVGLILAEGSVGQVYSSFLKSCWTEAVAHAVEHLLCNLDALSSNPSPTKKIFKRYLLKTSY